MNTPNHDELATQQPEAAPEWLQSALRDLPQEMNPDRDLWPAISQQIDRTQQINQVPRQRWIPVAIAASVVVSLLSVGVSVQLYQQQQALRNDMAQLMMEKIESPYQFARASYEQQWPSIKKKLSPETALIVEQNLRVIADARDKLAQALHKNPDDQVVQSLLRKTLSQEIDTYAQVQKISQKSDQTI